MFAPFSKIAVSQAIEKLKEWGIPHCPAFFFLFLTIHAKYIKFARGHAQPKTAPLKKDKSSAAKIFEQ